MSYGVHHLRIIRFSNPFRSPLPRPASPASARVMPLLLGQLSLAQHRLNPPATENTTHARLTFSLSFYPRLTPVGPLVFYYVMLGSHEPQRKRDGKRDLRAKETAVMSHGHRNKQRTLSKSPTCFQPITNSMMSVPISLPLSFPALYTAQSITLILSLAAKIPSSCNLT